MQRDLPQRVKEFIESSQKLGQKPLIILLGPTASGKTALGLNLAKEFNGEIISADSRQVYQEMDIATDAILPEQMEGVPHHLLRVLKPDEVMNLAEYKLRAETVAEDILARGKIPFLVGGTGLYISAIAEGYNLPNLPIDEKLKTLRANLTLEAKERGNTYMHQKLAELDSDSADSIHPNNLRYVLRALEINLLNKSPKKVERKGSPKFSTFKIGIEWPREKLYQRVGLRVDKQLERGLLKEVQALIDQGYNRALPSISSLGVKEIIPYLEGKMPLIEAIEILKRNTRNYAKRQITWFRRYSDIFWLKGEEL